jgi:N-acetylglucosaminyldiphosphoundecaprenol N-acetyl-beta-D-mannosaminyltransferase
LARRELHCLTVTHTDRTEFLGIEFNRLSFEAVVRQLANISRRSAYTYVVTPNVDHVVRLQGSPALALIYRQAALCLCDSRILARLAKLAGIRLPVVPGSDLTGALVSRVIQPGDRIAVVGCSTESIGSLRRKLPGVEIVHHRPPMGLRTNSPARKAAATFIADSQARFAFLAVGSPQQEMIANEVHSLGYARGAALCVGASLEFLTGEQRRAPLLLQRTGLEWAHRLASKPSAMWRRYLIDDVAIFPMFLRSKHSRRLRRLFLIWFLIVAVASMATFLMSRSPRQASQRRPSFPAETKISTQTVPPPVVKIDLPPPDLLRPLTTEQAAEVNAKRPFTKRADSPAAGLLLKQDAPNRLNALACLTQAIYYEAASEGVEGGRAVAQVVLNRVRHPAYPASVCGVVYQGSERATGCQFSFTCDGSLTRTPNPAIWERSRKIADKALSGYVYGAVGHATYYHADYVVPYWADSLDKTVQIGRHIFYRLRGSLGDSRVFRQTYAGEETLPLPALPLSLEALGTEPAIPAPPALAPGDPNKPIADAKPTASEPTLKPIADSLSGTLMADGVAATPIRNRRKQSGDCTAGAEAGQRLVPLKPNSVRGTDQPPSC